MTNLISNHHARLHERISSLVSRRAWPRKVQFAVFAGLISGTWACTGEGSALQVERDAALPSQESIAETSDANVSSGSTDVEWQPYPPDVVHTQDALRVQLENLPSEASAKRVEILHQLAKIAFEYNHFEEAHPFLTELLALDQESEIAVHSAEMLVDLFTIAWVQPQHALSPDPTADLEKVLNDVQAMPLYASPAGHRLREAVPHLRRGTKWKQALALQASDPRTCATMMDSITTEVPTEQRNSSILSAGLCYADAGEFTIASERLSQLSVPLAADLQEKADALRIRLKSPASSHR